MLPVPTKWRKCPPGTQSTTLVGVAKEEDIPFFDLTHWSSDQTHTIATNTFESEETGQIRSPNSLIESGAPERRMKIRGLSTTLFI